jgi:hypothetical protein
MNLKLCVWAALTIVTSLVACTDTGPMQIGKDTYSISVRVPLSGPSGAKGQALQEANTFCAKQNRQVLLDHENSHECALHGGCGEAEITFLCLAADDPRYTAPHQLRKDDGVLTTDSCALSLRSYPQCGAESGETSVPGSKASRATSSM